MKLDLHHLIERGLNWDDQIPDDLRQIWENHFQMMEEYQQYQRAIVPSDAVNLDIQTLDFGDASKHMICVVIYARFLRVTGSYSCQLVFARSRLVPDDMTLPRAELFAATLNAHTGEVVKRSFKDHHKSALKLSDSQIALFWINDQNKRLKPYVRNRVVEIRRFTNPENWNFIPGDQMIADLSTRKGVTIEEVNKDSTWFNGYPWMQKDISEFPIKSIEEVKLCVGIR